MREGMKKKTENARLPYLIYFLESPTSELMSVKDAHNSFGKKTFVCPISGVHIRNFFQSVENLLLLTPKPVYASKDNSMIDHAVWNIILPQWS